MMLPALTLAALASLRHHQLRSLLTMLGIVFGVGAVVSMLAISEGARHEALASISGMGLRNILIRSVKPSATALDAGSKGKGNRVLRYGLTFDDRRHLSAVVPGLERTVATRVIPQKVFLGPRRVDATLLATEPAYAEVAGLIPARGRFLTQLDQERELLVAVLGAVAARDLFAGEDPLGRTVRIGPEYARVIGVLAPKRSAAGGTGRSADELDRTLFLPEPAARAAFGLTIRQNETGSYQATSLEIADLILTLGEDLDPVRSGRLARHLLTRSHPQGDVEVMVPLELLEQKRRTQSIFTIVMGSIAGISLLVGGIGIMNIMLATVLERTREIGIRRAIGARRGDIVLQFLVETVVLCLLGAGLGLLAGIGGAAAVSHFAGWNTIVSAWSVLLSVAIAGGTGLIFGLYPAIRAARMDPVVALRHE